jgi:hypothetical protein
MRKSEMSEKQLHDRSTVIQILVGAGWRGSVDVEMFEKGRLCDPEARMKYESKMLSLEVDYLAESQLIMLSISKRSGERMDIAVYFQDQLEEILEAIISFQDSISLDNYKENIKKILQICPDNVYMAKGEKFVKLTDRDANNAEVGNDRATVEQ